MRKAVIFMMILMAGVASAALPVRRDYTNDVTDTIEKQGLTLMQEGSFDLYWHFTQGSTAKTLSNATSVIWQYAPPDRSWTVSVTGSVDNATTGIVKIPAVPAQLATNSTTDIFSWNLNVSGGGQTFAYAYGDLDIAENLAAQGLTLLTNTVVDWSQVASYLNPDDGPVQPGSGITASTNASGQVTFAASGSLTITAGDGIAVTTNASDRAVAVDSTVARDSDITSLSNNITAAYIAADVIVSSAFVAADTVVSNALQAQVTANAASLPLLNALHYNRPIFDFSSDGTNVTLTIDTTTGDPTLDIYFDSGLFSYSVPANITLANGTTNTAQENWIYATTNGLASSTTRPSGEYSLLGLCTLLDAAHTAEDNGPFSMQRFTDQVNGPNSDHRSAVSRTMERVRTFGATWWDGMAVGVTTNINGASNDDLWITIDSGQAWQMHLQAFTAVTNATGAQGYYILNDDGGISRITNLNQITSDADGNATLDANGIRFNVSVLAYAPSGTTNPVDARVCLSLSNGDYGNEGQALNDRDNKRVTSVDNKFKGGMVYLADIMLRRQNADGGTWTAIVTDRRGTALGSSGGGSSGSGTASAFSDTLFRVFDDADATKEIALDASSISTLTTRTLTAPDANGTIALVATSLQKSGGTMSGNITMGGNDLLSVDAIYGSGGDINIEDTLLFTGNDNLEHSGGTCNIGTVANPFANAYATTGTFSGNLTGEVPITLDTAATVVLTAANCRGTIRMNNDDDVIDYTLPDAEVGLVVSIANTIYAKVITVDPQVGDAIILVDRTVNTTGNAVDSSGAKDDSATFVAISSTQWLMYSAGNTWVDGGAD